MSNNCGPPKCKTCGKSEWRHVCIGVPKLPAKSKGILNGAVNASPKADPSGDGVALLATKHPEGKRTKRKDVSRASVETIPAPPSLVAKIEDKAAKRKEYLRLKAIARRARQKAEREKGKQP